MTFRGHGWKVGPKRKVLHYYGRNRGRSVAGKNRLYTPKAPRGAPGSDEAVLYAGNILYDPGFEIFVQNAGPTFLKPGWEDHTGASIYALPRLDLSSPTGQVWPNGDYVNRKDIAQWAQYTEPYVLQQTRTTTTPGYLELSGAGEFASTPSTSSLNLSGSFTLIALFRSDVDSGSGGVIDKTPDSGIVTGYGLDWASSGDRFRVYHGTGAGLAFYNSPIGSIPPFHDTWVKAVVTFGPSSTTADFYRSYNSVNTPVDDVVWEFLNTVTSIQTYTDPGANSSSLKFGQGWSGNFWLDGRIYGAWVYDGSSLVASPDWRTDNWQPDAQGNNLVLDNGAEFVSPTTVEVVSGTNTRESSAWFVIRREGSLDYTTKFGPNLGVFMARWYDWQSSGNYPFGNSVPGGLVIQGPGMPPGYSGRTEAGALITWGFTAWVSETTGSPAMDLCLTFYKQDGTPLFTKIGTHSLTTTKTDYSMSSETPSGGSYFIRACVTFRGTGSKSTLLSVDSGILGVE